jgi:RNA polymerase sigma factor (sigma-70 family)
MAKGFPDGVTLGQIRTLFDGGAVGGLSDGELLGRFLDDRDESGEAAFEALVHRHGPLVFGVCRRTLRDPHQAEDAFQATFLLLARKARSIRNREAVGPWLVGVAVKVATRAKGDAIRRRSHEGQAAGLAPRWLATDSADPDEVDLLLREVDRLRRPLREAVVLCHLQGLTYDSAAQALGVTEGTIRGRLARARELLRARLVRRGVAADRSTAVLLMPRLFEAVPDRLIGPLGRVSRAVLAGRAGVGIVPGSAITLMEGALKSMRLAKWKTTAWIILGVGMLTLGSTFRVQARQKPEAAKKGEATHDEEAKAEPKDLSEVVEGRIKRSVVVSKDCMILAYMPDWAHGNVDNLGIASNNGGVRTLVDWPDVPPSEVKSPDLKFYLAFYSRETTPKPKPGSILAFELSSPWPELTSWNAMPDHEPDPVLTAKFEPGDGWKLFDITAFVRDKEGKSGDGLMFRFLSEDRNGGTWSGYKLVSREGVAEWARCRPRLVVVDPIRK